MGLFINTNRWFWFPRLSLATVKIKDSGATSGECSDRNLSGCSGRLIATELALHKPEISSVSKETYVNAEQSRHGMLRRIPVRRSCQDQMMLLKLITWAKGRKSRNALCLWLSLSNTLFNSRKVCRIS